MDQQEFADRTEAIKTRLYRTAYLYLGSEADALEAVDETVYRALRKLKRLQAPAFFETWITWILISTCRDELRRRGRFPSRRGGCAAGCRRAGRLRASAAGEAIRRLPEELRSVVILRFFSGYSQAETAAALNIPQGTAATRQKRALALLKLELGEEGQA
ncbi:MAG: sigma factor [Dysosmobacter sp.]